MEILKQRPPNYAEILKVFKQASAPTVIFAYAPNIYNPGGMDLPPDLVEHEKVHIGRQDMVGVERWWELYLTDLNFRFEEELIAHRAEYRFLMANCANRNTRRMALKHVANKLAAGLYNNMISPARAQELIKAEHYQEKFYKPEVSNAQG